MESKPPSEPSKSTAEIAYRPNEAAEPVPATSRKHLRRAMVGALIGGGIVWALQWRAPSYDHQVANMVSVAVCSMTVVFIIYQLQRWAGKLGHRLGIPAVVVLLTVGFSTLFQFDGFSGEMLPQFKLRFGSPPPELRSLRGSPAASSVADKQDEQLESVSQDVAKAESTGFLGSNRTGVIPTRSFDVSAIESNTKTLWNQGIGEGWSSFAVSDDLAVTLEQRDELECVTCYRLTDGELLWNTSHQARHEHPLGGIGPRSTPTISGDRVYAQGATGRVWCLNLRTGETIWSVDLLDLAGWDQLASEMAITWGRATSPLIVDGLCVVPYGGPKKNQGTGRSLIAFDADTGEVVWTAGEAQISYGSPGLLTLAGKRQIVSVNEITFTCHHIQDGTVLWEFDWPGQSNGGANCAMAVSAGNDRFLIGKGYGGGSALVQVTAQADGSFAAQAVWAVTRLLKTKFTHACVDGDVAYAISNGSLEAVAINDARQLWQQPRRSRFGQGQILLVEDTIIAQSESGEVVFVAADPTEYKEIAGLSAMHSKTWNIPTVAGRYLLVRNDRRAVCFLLPERID